MQWYHPYNLYANIPENEVLLDELELFSDIMYGSNVDG